MKYVVDMDGVLTDFNTGFAKELMLNGADTIPFADPTFPDRWAWPLDYAKPEVVGQTWTNVLGGDSFWAGLGELPWTQTTLRLLSSEVFRGFEVYFVTSRGGNNVKKQTESWIQKHGFWHPTVIVVNNHNKWGVIKDLQADVVIDDRPEVLVDARAWGKKHLRLYLQAATYNTAFVRDAAEQHKIIPVETADIAIRSEIARREIY